MSNLFISHDLGYPSSGDMVCQQEIQALKLLGEEVIEIGYNDSNPTKYNLPNHPFMQDYLVLNRILNLDLSKIKIAHFYGTPFKSTINYLIAKGIITTHTVAAHNRLESIKEFENLMIPYPFEHIKNDLLWEMYFGKGDADVIIVPSMTSKEALLHEGCKQRIEIIPHGVMIPEPDKIKPLPNEFRCGYLGSCGPDKGLYYLIKAWESLNYKDSVLTFAGHHTKEFIPQFIKQLQISTGRFNVQGFVNNIADFYNNISVYIQPSATEAMGMEVIESASYGRPIICSDGAGASDFIEDGVNGFVVEKRNVEELSNKIRHFKDNPNEIERMGKNAREKSLQYNWDKIRERYIRLWRSLLKK